MAFIKPFRAIRPVPEEAKQAACVPYDVVDTEEARKLAQGNPVSFLHVTRPEIDLPQGTDLYHEAVYRKAKQNFDNFIHQGILIQDDQPSIYVYRMTMGDHQQVGIAACCSVDEYDKDIIKKHEYTRREKEDDRLRHMLAISAHAGPVLLTFRGNAVIEKLLTEAVNEKPLYDLTDEQEVRHTIWKLKNPGQMAAAFQDLPVLYIADGHHRAAGASRVKQEMLKKNPQSSGDEEWRYFLAVMFPSDQMRIFPYNRYITDLGGMSAEDFVNRAGQIFRVMKNGKKQPVQKGQMGMYVDGCWYELFISESAYKEHDPVGRLDLSVFQKKLLEPVLGITDQKNDKRIDFVGGPDSPGKLEKLVDEKGGAAFSFYPVSVEELLAVADAGKIMPPKSTWFAPKLRSGLLIHSF
ncbi:MAG: DUF1015 domain-containing protein [Spirochaetota bacterium]